MIHGVGGGPAPPDIPSFVTHEPSGEELSLISSLYACTRNCDDDMSFYQGWKDKQLVPEEGNSVQNKDRQRKKRKQRIARLRYWNGVYAAKAHGLKVPESTVPPEPPPVDLICDGHSFCAPAPASRVKKAKVASSPNGVDTADLARAIEQLSESGIEQLSELPSDAIECLLDAENTKVAQVLAGGGGRSVQSISQPGSSVGNVWDMDVDHVLGELRKMETISTQLSGSGISDVVSTLRSSQPNNRIHPQKGSVLIHSSLPTPVADRLKGLVRDEDPSMPTLFVTRLRELGVAAIGQVFARGKERIVWLPGAVSEERKDDVKTKLRKMMEDFQEEQEVETDGFTDFVVYFDTEESVEPTIEVGEQLNAAFALTVLRQARAEGVALSNEFIQMLDDHERRQAKLELAESTISSAYEIISRGVSRAGSSVAVSSVLDPTTPKGSRWPGFSAPSDVVSPPSTSLASAMAATLARDGVRDGARVQHSHRASSAVSSMPGWLHDAAEELVEKSSTPPPVRPKPTEVQDAQHTAGAGEATRHRAPVVCLAEESYPAGNAFDELTHPHAPSAQLIAEFDGQRPAGQRSRVPAPSGACALNEHLKKVGAEIDGEQPFEMFGEHIEEDCDEPILDKVLKERHEQLHRYEKWTIARVRWLDSMLGSRLLLNDRPVTNVQDTMSNGQKLEFLGSSDGCLYGVLARHVHGTDDEASRKLVADRLVEWLIGTGENNLFHGVPLRNWVRWDRVPPNITNWTELVAHLRDSYPYLEYTAADWLLFIAAAHVFGPVIVFSVRLSRAVRFVAADREVAERGLRGYADGAHLPAASQAWLRVALLDNGHLVRCRSKELMSEIMLRMCDTRDIELQQQLRVEVQDAVLFQGPSKAGKSTIMNALGRRVLYDSTPPRPKKGERKGGMIKPELSVLGAPIKGSEIGTDMESETLLVNSIVIKTDDDEQTPYLQLLDTPGMFDTRGPLIEVVNMISIAKCMKRFKTLRIVVMVRESALDGTGEGFANTAAAMSRLFSMSGGSASAKKHVLLWINPHKPEADYNDDGVVEEIKKVNAAHPQIRDFLRTIVSQHKSRKVVHVLEFDKETAQDREREEIVRARLARYPNDDPDADVTKAVFEVDELIAQLVALSPMHNPAEKCGLPLTEKATAEIARQAAELHDYISLRCELSDYGSLKHHFDVLQALCKHLQAGSSALQGQSAYATTYQASLTTVAERLKSTCGQEQMAALCMPFGQPVVLKASDLDSVCFAMRAAAGAAVLEAHLLPFLFEPNWKALGVDMGCETVTQQLSAASEGARKLLSDHFIHGTSGLQAAYGVFGEQIKGVLTKMKQAKERFALEASIADGASASFQAIATEAEAQLQLLLQVLFSAVETQKKAASQHVMRGLQEAASMASRHLESLASKEEPSSELEVVDEREATDDPYDAAGNALDVVRCAEESLSELMAELQGVYESSRSHTIATLLQQSETSLALIEQSKEGAVAVSDETIGQILASLLFLLHARSSSLRKHCASEGASLIRLDGCYEEPVGRIVEWHAELTKGALEAAKRGNDSFVKNLSDYRPQIELSTALGKLAAVESIQMGKRAVVRFAKWDALHKNDGDLTRRIDVALDAFSASVDYRLKEHSSTIANATLEVVESYPYKEHAKDLVVLHNARWCDRILPQPKIEACIDNVWHAFEKHMRGLAQGDDGAMACLRRGKHKEARTLLVQIHSMESLLDGSLIADVDAAQHVKEMHDEVEKMANGTIADKCDKARTKVLDRPGPTGRERWDWWIDIGVRDANFTDALWHLNAVLDLAAWLITASKGQNLLEGWLNLEELEKVQIDCANRANDLVSRLHSRAHSFFTAVGSCQSEAMDEAAAQLMGEIELAEDVPSGDTPGDTGSEDSLPGKDLKATIKGACRELKDVLQLLSRPSTYAALFSATCEQATPDSTPNDSFHDLERLFQSTLMECQINFGDEETEPVVRQKALLILSEFDRSLPTDKSFESFKKTFQASYQHLVNAHQLARRGEISALRGHFANYEFDEETKKMMVNLRNSAEADSRARGAYDAACSLLSGHVRALLENVAMSFTHLKYPEQGFRAQDHLVKPWNQLQAAERCLSEFLHDAPGSTQMNLDLELQQMAAKFETVFKDDVLQPFAKMFDLGDYTSAEGDTTFGMKRVHDLTNKIQAQGGVLGRIAQSALADERARQTAELEKLHLRTFDMSFELPVDDEEGYLGARARNVDIFLEQSFSRLAKMDQIVTSDGDCKLLIEYKAAHGRIHKEVQSFLMSEFGPLFKDGLYDMRTVHVDYLDRLLEQMIIGGYAESAMRLLNIPGSREAIERFRSLSDHQEQQSFSSMTPEQQADAIRRTSPQSKSYINLVSEFHVAHKNALQRADTLLTRTNPAAIPPGEIEEVVAEVRARAACAHELKGIKFDMKAVASLESNLRKCRAEQEVFLTTSQQSPLLAAFDTRDPSRAALMDSTLFHLIHTYKSLVKLAPLPDAVHDEPTLEEEPCPTAAEQPSSVEEPAENERKGPLGFVGRLFSGGSKHSSADESNGCQALTHAPAAAAEAARTSKRPASHHSRRAVGLGGQVIELLRNRLTEALSQWQDPPETAQHISLKHQSLLRLQRWEPAESGVNEPSGPASLFDVAVELEAALIQEGSLTRNQQKAARQKKVACPAPHDARMQKTFDEVQKLLKTAEAAIDYFDTFDSEADSPIDPKPFEMIFSREFDELIQLVGSEHRAGVEQLKDTVADKAEAIHHELSNLLAERRNQRADKLLKKWQYLEPLSRLATFKELPGPEDFDAQLKAHASKLAQQAKAAVAASDKKSQDWAKPVSMPLLHLAKFGFDIPRAAIFCNESMAEVLSAAESKFGAQGMQTLATELREREPALGNEIISSSDAFVAVTVADFNQKTQRDISVVKRLYAEKNKDAENEVWHKFDTFEKEYNLLLQHCTDGLEHIEDPLAYLVEQARRYASMDKGIIYDSQEHIPKVLAAIFAWWSMDFLVKLRKRQTHLVADPKKLRRANNGQVVCILRLLGCASSWTRMGAQFKNHLAEVPTGEGKSVVLGVLATTLALYGFQVDCVCYSSMLSTRDGDDFKAMFLAFGLQDQIRYGTFDTLCEALIRENYGDIRQTVFDFLATGNVAKSVTAANRTRALIIDEVDVFCSEAFFGGAYSPVLTLQTDEIADLMKHIWSKRSMGFDLHQLKQHAAYQAVLNSGVVSADNEWVLERAVREMDKAARGYAHGSHGHIVRNGKILYKVDGRDEFGSWTYDYETNVEYLAEYDRGNLNQQQLNAGLSIYVRCGEFSFAALPSMFQHILGVTGTLDSQKLPPQMHEVLQTEIRIEQFTYCPSMYHAQKRDFQPSSGSYVQLAKDVDEHRNFIVDEIDSRLMPTTEMDARRSVIVFFPSAEELHGFRDSSYFDKFRDKAQVLTELTASRREDRDNLIRSATRQGTVTLATRIYGRGTDFKIFDERMETAGGMHVLQTFFSRDLSEEVQIMGRCARQGNKGSYSQVLLSASVAKDFDLTVETVHGWERSEIYDKLCKLRADAGTAEVKSLREMANKRKTEHNVLVSSLNEFQKRNRADPLRSLLRRYNSPGGLVVGPNGLHVIFCLDESASMSSCGWLSGPRGGAGSPWAELMNAVDVFWQQSAAEPGPPMCVSVVQFGSTARVTQRMVPLQGSVPALSPQWSGTAFKPAVDAAASLIANGGGPTDGYTTVVVFMSDGAAADATSAARVLENLAQQYAQHFASFTVGFGDGAPRTLEQMAFANGVPEKNNYRAASVGNLAEAFSAVAKSIAPGRL